MGQFDSEHRLAALKRATRTETERIVEAVRRNQTPLWYVLANDEGHGFRKRRNADYQFYLTVMFLQRYLLQ